MGKDRSCGPTCCIPLRKGILLFTVLCLILQMATCSIFLVFEMWLVTVPVAFVLLFHGYFLIIIQKQRPFLLRIFTAYEYLCIAAYTGLLIWSATLLSDPNGEKFANPFLTYCSNNWNTVVYENPDLQTSMNNCATLIQYISGSLVALSLIGILFQGYTDFVIDKYSKSMEVVSKQRIRRSLQAPNAVIVDANLPVVVKVRSGAAVSFNLTPEQRVRSGSI